MMQSIFSEQIFINLPLSFILYIYLYKDNDCFEDFWSHLAKKVQHIFIYK